MKPETASDNELNEEDLAEFQARLSRLGQIEVPLWPFRWMAMAVLFVVGLLVSAFFTICTLAFGGPFIFVSVGAAFSLVPNRYVKALGFGVLAPALLGMLGVLMIMLGMTGLQTSGIAT